MGESDLLARAAVIVLRACGLASALLFLAPSVPAQPKRERLTYSWVMELRHQLWSECRGKSPERLEQVAADLRAEAKGNPLIPLAHALARVRGVEADEAFVFRRGVQCLATPEIVDVDRFAHVNLTLHMPYRMPGAERPTFALRVLDAAGEERWSGTVTENATIDDLLRYRADGTRAGRGSPRRPLPRRGRDPPRRR